MLSILNDKDSMNKLTLFISSLASLAITLSDIGVSYTQSELKIYTNPLIQIIIAFAVSYNLVENLHLSILLSFLWFVIKYKFDIKTFINRENIENNEENIENNEEPNYSNIDISKYGKGCKKLIKKVMSRQ